MEQYPKIQTVFKRNITGSKAKGKVIVDEFSCPEFEYLKDNLWIFTEKVDGTNIRIYWERGVKRVFGGRTDNAQIPAILIEVLEEMFPLEKLDKAITKADSLTLFGEGYGAKIQKGGGNYIPDGVSFILFDVLVDNWWLKRADVNSLACDLSIRTVPILGTGGLLVGTGWAAHGIDSAWGDFNAEGLVMRPAVELKNRAGHRIITKIKCKDF